MSVLSRAVSAARLCRNAKPRASVVSGVPRDKAQRRAMAKDPWAYAHDVLGYELTKQEDEILAAALEHSRLLVPAAQNVGKTFMGGLLSLWRFDCWGELVGPDGRAQGCRILLVGPGQGNVMNIYRAMLEHASRAESRGFGMPGRRSELSVYWTVPGHPSWHIEPVAPPKSVTQQQSHRAAGRHHVNQHAIIEEGLGVEEALWRAIEGVCSGEGNSIVSPYNPTEASGPTITREETGEYHVVRLSALDHPNVQRRVNVVPGAVSFRRIDSLVRNNCENLGPYPQTPVEPDRGEFVYALAPKTADDPRPRADGIAGHADAKPHVYRPDSTAEVSILGRTASSGANALFSAASITSAFDRARERVVPSGPPSSVGLDPARFGGDDSRVAPRWGEGAEALLLAYAAAMERGPKALAEMLDRPRTYVGPISLIPKGDGPATAEALFDMYPASPATIDDNGIGASVYDHAARIMKKQAFQLSFAGAPPTPTPGELQAENMRAAVYIRAALVLRFALVDVWQDQDLMQELLAHRLVEKSRSIEDPVTHEMKRVASYLVTPKEDVVATIGRSPDKAEAFVLALADPLVPVVGAMGAATGDAGKLAAAYRKKASEGMFTGRRPR